MPDMKKISMRITFDPDQLAWLKGEASRRRVSMSLIIREFIMHEMAMDEAKLEEAAANEKAP